MSSEELPPPTLEATRAKAKDHAVGSMFQQYPCIGTMEINNASEGEGDVLKPVNVVVPYHNYGANAMILWGHADAEWVTKAIRGPYKPLLRTDGRANVAVWAVDYRETMLNPYKEYIIVFSVVHAHLDAKPVDSPHQLLQLFQDKEALPYVYKLWLDKQLPTSYGRQLLGCDKYLDRSMVLDFKGDAVTMEANHVQGEIGGPEPGCMIKGTLTFKEETQLISLVKAFGLKRTLGMAAGVEGSWNVITPPGIMNIKDSHKYNPVWTFLFETTPKFTSIDKDPLEYGGELKAMAFEGTLAQHDPSLRAVLLAPWSFTNVAE